MVSTVFLKYRNLSPIIAYAQISTSMGPGSYTLSLILNNNKFIKQINIQLVEIYFSPPNGFSILYAIHDLNETPSEHILWRESCTLMHKHPSAVHANTHMFRLQTATNMPRSMVIHIKAMHQEQIVISLTKAFYKFPLFIVSTFKIYCCINF